MAWTASCRPTIAPGFDRRYQGVGSCACSSLAQLHLGRLAVEDQAADGKSARVESDEARDDHQPHLDEAAVHEAEETILREPLGGLGEKEDVEHEQDEDEQGTKDTGQEVDEDV